jgi:hypothetical protein
VYKQPKVKLNTLIECIDNIMNQCVNSDFNLVLIGDFNVYMLKKNKDFKDCLDVNGLSNIVKKATCFKGVPSLID